MKLDSTEIDAGIIRPPGPAVLLVVCTILGTLSFARYSSQVPGQAEVWKALPFWLACYYPWVLLAPAAFRLEARFPLASGRRLRNALALLAASVPFSLAGFLASVWLTLVGRMAGLASGAGEIVLVANASYDLLAHQIFFWASVGAGAAIRHIARLQRRERAASRLALEKSQLEASLRNAELEVLRMRLNPHFLFNTLQNVSVLLEEDPSTAHRMLLRLSDVIRAAFRREYTAEVTLEDELRLTRSYLEIEQLRFGDRLSFSIDEDPATQRALVPTLLLQPVVENSIRHGLRNIGASGRIEITIRAEQDSLVILVADDGAGFREGGVEFGVGLGGTAERLQKMYPGRSDLRMENAERGGTITRIALPLRFPEAAGEVEHA